jgi:glycosyltransferase involved in cell wall biosynthesis
MKRVAFFLHEGSSDWLGGVSYIRNLLTAIYSIKGRKIEPVLFISSELDTKCLVGLPPIEIISTSFLKTGSPVRLASRFFYGVLKRDLMLELLLRKHRIDVLSHSYEIGRNSRVASVCWIPDFQHIRMPEYFKKKELQARNKQFRRMINGCHRIILSSYDAQKDFEAFAPDAIDKSCVLRFVSCLKGGVPSVSREELFVRYNIDRPYFHLPNQFWVHKNHAVVIDALAILKKRGENLLVLATGKTADYRDPAHFDSLMALVKQKGVDEDFRVLGVVPLDDLQSLMLNAIALINPSNFEGWSTTVEESKSLGLSIILSDISVHIEQSPLMGLYFKAGSAEDLADKMVEAVRIHDPTVALQARELALEQQLARIRNFGSVFQGIALDAIRQVQRQEP